MPTEIVIVRHGQCTGNVADRASYKGDHRLFTKEIRSQKSSLWSLTPTGIRESKSSGEWIRNKISPAFDYYFSSDYVRAIETAAHMGFEKSCWKENSLLREREWGGSENLPYSERNELFQRFGTSLTEDSLSWSPPNGESMITIIEKVKSFLDEVKMVTSGKRVLIVSHGAPLQAFRVLQHKVEPSRYTAFINKGDYIRNCHIFHYLVRKDESADIPMYSLERSAYLNSDHEWIEAVQQI